jgi:hypothetical protein
MPTYCVNRNAQANGDHEVHDVTANRWCLPAVSNRVDLGYHSDCTGAVRQAKWHYPQANGCANCTPSCHTT